MTRFLMLVPLLSLLLGCGVNDAKEEAEIQQYKNQPLQRDGDRLNPRRD
ncbi:MAG: hypothetical protein U1E83_06350 [Methylotetracoccus sp.]